MAGGLLRPAEAARELGMAANTLRVYASKFAPLLSSAASQPSAGRGGGAGHRLYAPEDLAILGRARDLVSGGVTYEEALAELQSRPAPAPRPAGVIGAGAEIPADLAAHLATLQQAVDAWRSLVEERAREAAGLRARVSALEAELQEERQGRLAAEELVRLAGRRPVERGQPQGSWLARFFPGESEAGGEAR